MLEFIKMFGMGILYTILSPFILAFYLLFVVYSFFNYLVCESIYLGGFFLGRKFDDTTELERKLIKVKKEKEALKQKELELNNQVVITHEDGDLNA